MYLVYLVLQELTLNVCLLWDTSNHKSPRRGEAFVTRKITQAAAKIKLGMQVDPPKD